MQKIFAICIAAVSVTGCSYLAKEQPIDTTPKYDTGNLDNIVSKDPCPPSPAGQIATQCISAVAFQQLYTIESSYDTYKDTLLFLVSGGNAYVDITALGLNAAGVLVPAATTKAILAAASGSLIGAQGKIDADILYNNSIATLITQMDADRAAVKATILGKLNSATSGTTYRSIAEAAIDLRTLYEAGTLAHAVVTLASNAGTKLTDCKKLETAAASGGTAPAAGSCN